MDSYFVIRYGSEIRYSGVDMSARCGTVIKENKRVLVVKWPGGTHWSGRGSRSYHSPSIHVLEKPESGARHNVIIEWDVKKGAVKP